ncbi:MULTISPECIES: CocE/NonD family hydrolase [Pseudoalteromonas]|uniref:CocE/NonD family hydrolase n=1 Tax=Pseudoalteromonas TaxID=53246 RepID=UPI0021758BB5|nr:MULTISPECIES: CocE/NonD family hydrolase [unclassified Pseudoalteromonas]
MKNNKMTKFIGLFCCLIFASFIQAEENKQEDKRAEYIRSHYAKYEYQIPMRDGTKLFTAVYVPYDKSSKYPIMMQRTPYRVAPYGVDKYKAKLGPSEIFEEEGFIFVFQDVRGKFMSEGSYVNMRPQDAGDKGGKAVDDATDTYDTIDWLVKNIPNNNGKVGMWGTSYPGYYTSVAAINSHKALKAISPQAPIANWFYDDFHRNGAFSTPMAFIFFDTFDKQREGQFAYWPEGMDSTTPDGYEFFRKLGPLSNVNKKYFNGERPFWNELTEHPNYDEFWQKRDVLQHLDNVKPATLIVGGWYDTEDLYGPLATYQKMSKHNKKDNVHIIMGPWYHGQWNRGEGDKMGEANFGFDTSEWFQEHILLPFFKHNLKGTKEASLAKATIFETGANRWREFDTWPPKETSDVTLYLGNNEQLLTSTDKQGGSSDYISDPNKPVPHSAHTSRGWDRPYMAEDQRFTARRTDVLVFNSDVAKEDQTIAGAIDLNLYVSTSQSAADFVVKLVDVFPGMDESTNKVDEATGNRHELVRWGIIRGRFRDSMSEPKPFEANKPTLVNFELLDVLHTIKRGHKLQIQVQSSMFPFMDMNPQKYVDNIFKAKAEDFVKAQHKLYHSEQYPSSISFKVIGH